jgi:hypothetical protein
MGGNKSGRAPVNHTAIHHRGRALRVNDPFTVGARVLRRALDDGDAGGAPRQKLLNIEQGATGAIIPHAQILYPP